MAHILIIDDDHSVLSYCNACLFDTHMLQTALSANEGLSKLVDHAIDLIITDIIMPERDGLEVIQEVKERYPHIPLIAMSGGLDTMPTDVLNAARAFGAIETLVKPFTQDLLHETIDRVLGDSD
ncbi:MAG: response regulator [Magnetovibrio sp.]|nr:response regulator [Magnetovibrio sp.]